MSAKLRERLIWNGCVGLVTILIGLNGTAFAVWVLLLTGMMAIAIIGLGPRCQAWLRWLTSPWRGGNAEPDHCAHPAPHRASEC